MIVAGGSYDEVCFEPRWEEKFGSGLRACRTLNALDANLDIEFHTFGDDNTELYLNQIVTVFSKIKFHLTKIPKTVSFYYDHPLIVPRIFPRLDTIKKQENTITVKGDNVLFFGFIEGDCQVHGNRVVYDPQSPSNPKSFTQTRSTANELAIVINYAEASSLAKSANIDDIKNFFINNENAKVLVIKMGPKGALVIDRESQTEILVPVYITPKVWPIGSGDVFASTFAYYWFNGVAPSDAAKKASWNTAQYCSTRVLDFEATDQQFNALTIKDFPKDIIYLAGPFFTYAERWLIDQIRSALIASRLTVFSPWHDIGHGVASDVVPKDIAALEKSGIVFAVIDGLDSGTLFEVGYAVKKQIPVIAYVENESTESIKMLEGTGCYIEKDLTTAIYKCFWLLSKDE